MVIILKIKEIRKFDIEVKKDENIIYTGSTDNADDSIKNLDIIEIEIKNKVLKIKVQRGCKKSPIENW